MKISFAATNPCHLFPFARALFSSQNLGTYFSGYPRWKLEAPREMPIRSFPIRTVLTYGLLRLPHSLRPKNRTLFRWQDKYFDENTAGAIGAADAIHGIPGQCLETFRRARKLGITTVLNHATGPTQHVAELIRPEFERLGLNLETETAYDQVYLDREKQEYELADYHCVASSVVREQLIKESDIPAERIWTVPYAADESLFYPPQTHIGNQRFQLVFAGQLSLRKGIRFLLEALAVVENSDIDVQFYGSVSPEVKQDLANYSSRPKLHFHGAVSQSDLANAFRQADALVLPSIEEGFGLVVPQALNCGLPCIVSDRVGASDLIRHRQNGSIFCSKNSTSLAMELSHWQLHPKIIEEKLTWIDCANTLTSFHRQILPA